jgi:hypothetical protein
VKDLLERLERVGKGRVADPGLRRFLDSLDASFDAAVAREEDQAASDLALSLLQGRPLSDVALRDGRWAIELGGAHRLPLCLVGADFVESGGRQRVLVPAARAVLVRRSHRERARACDQTLVQRLRALLGKNVAISADSGDFKGTLVRVGPDYVVVATPAGDVLAALGGVRWIRAGGWAEDA